MCRFCREGYPFPHTNKNGTDNSLDIILASIENEKNRKLDELCEVDFAYD